jgi:hypothetical protein
VALLKRAVDYQGNDGLGGGLGAPVITTTWLGALMAALSVRPPQHGAGCGARARRPPPPPGAAQAAENFLEKLGQRTDRQTNNDLLGYAKIA